jgi:hypothetical protein
MQHLQYKIQQTTPVSRLDFFSALRHREVYEYIKIAVVQKAYVGNGGSATRQEYYCIVRTKL